MSRPDVLLLTIDTLRADLPGCYGYPRPTTPNLDRLAATGLRFTAAFTAGTWTQAAFPPLLTSSSASFYGGSLGILGSERPSPIEALAAHGYTTAGFSTNPHLSRATGYNRGFRHFFDLDPVEKDPWLRRIKGGEFLLRQPLTHRISRLFGRRSRPARLYVSAGEVTDTLCHWMDAATRPFFAWAHYMDVHWPYYLEESLTEPKRIAAAWQDLHLMHRWANHERDGAVTNDLRQRFVHLYERSLQYVDAQIGRLADYLEKSGRASNTVIVIVSDHGEEFFDHGRWGHLEDNLCDEIIKVPLIIRLVDSAAGQVIGRLVSTLDILPTVLDLCGCPAPGGLEGSSLRPIWQPDAQGNYDRQAVICEMPRDSWHRIAVRTDDFKLIWDNRCPDTPELYDLKGDPQEQSDVAGNHPQVVRQLNDKVNAHLSRAAATRSAGDTPELEFDEIVAKRLRDMGYLD